MEREIPFLDWLLGRKKKEITLGDLQETEEYQKSPPQHFEPQSHNQPDVNLSYIQIFVLPNQIIEIEDGQKTNQCGRRRPRGETIPN